jgi:hypothetical protein
MGWTVRVCPRAIRIRFDEFPVAVSEPLVAQCELRKSLRVASSLCQGKYTPGPSPWYLFSEQKSKCRISAFKVDTGTCLHSSPLLPCTRLNSTASINSMGNGAPETTDANVGLDENNGPNSVPTTDGSTGASGTPVPGHNAAWP